MNNSNEFPNQKEFERLEELIGNIDLGKIDYDKITIPKFQRPLQTFQDYSTNYDETISNNDGLSFKDDLKDESTSKIEGEWIRIIFTQAKIKSIQKRWDLKNPKIVLDEIFAGVPDRINVYTLNNIGKMPQDVPSDFELYLLSKIDNLPIILDISKKDGSLRAIESIKCLRDKIRTKMFLQGITDTIQNLSRNSEEIYVCDAGCGALPILSIYAALSSPKVKVTAIELNPNSVEIAKRVVKGFHLEDQIEIIKTNAITYRSEKEIDLLVSETMHSGLIDEPIVQIMSNLTQYVKKNGEVLPKKVVVKSAPITIDDYGAAKGYVKIGKNIHQYVKPNWKNVTTYFPGDNLQEISFSLKGPFQIRKDYFVLLASEVNVGKYILHLYNSLITIPQVVRDSGFDPLLLRPKSQINVRYRPGVKLNQINCSI
jgi:precorrin-6B methylase 2